MRKAFGHGLRESSAGETSGGGRICEAKMDEVGAGSTVQQLRYLKLYARDKKDGANEPDENRRG